MECNDWQNKNFDSLIETFRPSESPERLQFMEVMEAAYSDLPLNPWVDIFEILVLAYKSNFVSKKHLLELAKITQLGYSFPKEFRINKIPKDSLLWVANGILTENREVETYESFLDGNPFFQFGIFLNMHFHFRNNIPKILLGISRQGEVAGELKPDKLEAFLDDRLGQEIPVEWNAFNGIFALFGHISQLTYLFETWPFFLADLKMLYHPWLKKIETTTLDSWCNLLRSLQDLEGVNELPNDDCISKMQGFCNFCQLETEKFSEEGLYKQMTGLRENLKSLSEELRKLHGDLNPQLEKITDSQRSIEKRLRFVELEIEKNSRNFENFIHSRGWWTEQDIIGAIPRSEPTGKTWEQGNREELLAGTRQMHKYRVHYRNP